MKLKSPLINLVVLLCSALVVLVLAEGAFRVRLFLIDKKQYELRDVMMDKLQRGDYSEHQDVYGPMIKLSDNEKIVFELKPHINWKYQGAMVKTNRYGFRGKDYEYKKSPGVVRIFGIGDSVMFGQGVSEENTYLSVLEGLLNKKYAGKKWEVINSGVPEYNTKIEVETLKGKGLKFSPDMVILGFTSNDIYLPTILKLSGLPEKIDFTKRYLTVRQSFLAMFVRHRINPALPEAPPYDNRYEGYSGGRSLANSLSELSWLSKQYGFEVLVLFLTHQKTAVDSEFMRIAQALQFSIVDMEPLIQGYMKAKGFDDYYGTRELTVPDNHPSKLVHQMTGEAIVDNMVQTGLADRLHGKE